jgi:hypothetical protein
VNLTVLRLEVRRKGWSLVRQVARWLHPLTLGNLALAFSRGVFRFMKWSRNYLKAVDRNDLRMSTQSGAKQHLDLCKQRLRTYVVAMALVAAALIAVAVKFPYGRLLDFVVLSGVFVGWGYKSGTALAVATPQIGKNHTESLIKGVTNELTLTPALVKAEESCRIVMPIHSIPSGTGYMTEVELPGLAAKKVILGRENEFSAKLGKGDSQVHLSAVRGRSDHFGLLVLHEDPWDTPSTQNPLVVSPREVDLWNEAVELGLMPTLDPYGRKLQEEGGGGNGVVGAAPRHGKTNLMSNLIVPVMLCPDAEFICIDGKGVDWKPCEPVALRYIIKDDRRAVIDTLKECIGEIDRRQTILERLGASYITERITKELGMKARYVFLDETSIYTEDAPTALRNEFLEALGTVMRLGPTYGLYVFLASQRPTDKGIPPGIRDLAVFRAALYSMTSHASQAILGAGGDANRADRLEEDQKGVAIVRGDGMIRTHLVGIKDLERVARFAGSLRALAGPAQLRVLEDQARSRPLVVQAALEAMDTEQVEFMETSRLVGWLASQVPQLSGLDPNGLASEMKKYGVRPAQATRAEHPQRLRGYRKADLLAVPPVVTRLRTPAPDTVGNAGGTTGDRG